MNFPRTIASVCSGTSGFPSFLAVHPLRALLHLAMLAFLAAVFIAVCRFFPMESWTARSCVAIAENFGEMKFEKSGVFPSKPISSHFALILSPQLRIDYFPAAASIALSEMDEWASLAGVIWTPELAAIWVRTAPSEGGEAKYVAHPLRAGDLPSGWGPATIGKAQIEALMKDAKYKEPKTPIEPVDFKALASYFGVCLGLAFSLLLFGVSFIGIFVFTALVISFFASIQYIWVSGLSPKLRIGNIATISIYSAFPAIIIASMVPAFDIQFLSFHLVFFLCFFIYHMVAFNTIQKFLAPPNQQKPSSWEDDDDGF